MFLSKTDRMPPLKKAGKPPKKQLVFMKGNLCTWKEKVKVSE